MFELIVTERPKLTRANIAVLLLALTLLVAAFIAPQLTQLLGLMPLLWFFIERRVRERSRREVGLNIKALPQDLLRTLPLVLLVGVGTQSLFLLIYKQFPAVVEHLQSRVPADLSALNGQLFLTLAIAALGEEIAFRGLFQAHFGEVMKPGYAIVLTSLLFALIHFKPGAPLVVGLDLTSVFIDSLIFGLIFLRTKNVYAAWIAHLLGNLVATILMIQFF